MGAAYRTGTISVSNGSSTVTGSGTQFVANVSAGMMLVHDLRVIGEIDQVVSNTELQLVEEYQGTSISDDPYAIYNLGQVRAALRNAVAELISEIQGFQDGPLSGLFGDGTASEPGIAFSGQPGMGLSRDGNTLRMSTQGSVRARLSSSGFEATSYGGDGVTQSRTDTTRGRVAKVGDFGLGRTSTNEFRDDPDAVTGSGFYDTMPDIGYSNIPFIHLAGPGGNRDAQMFLGTGGDEGNIRYRARASEFSDDYGPLRKVWNEGNTTVDGNGFILEASPVLRLYADHVEEPVHPVGASMEHRGPGHYVLTGTPPLATVGWRTKGATDGDGRPLVTLDTPRWVGDELHVRTFVSGIAADIPDGVFVMLRFWSGDENATPPAVDAISEAQEQEAALEAERARMVCSRFQAKAALHGAELLDHVPAALESADPVAQLAWEDASEFKRNSPTILALAGEFRLGPDDLDELFRTAMQIEA